MAARLTSGHISAVQLQKIKHLPSSTGAVFQLSNVESACGTYRSIAVCVSLLSPMPTYHSLPSLFSESMATLNGKLLRNPTRLRASRKDLDCKALDGLAVLRLSLVHTNLRTSTRFRNFVMLQS